MSLRPVLAVFLMAAAACAEPVDPVRWWRLDAGDLQDPGKGADVTVCRTVEEAREAVRVVKDGKPATPQYVEWVSFEQWMLLVVPCSGNGGAKFDVEKIGMEDGKLAVACVRENNPDENKAILRTAIVLIVPKADGAAKAAWTDDTLKALHERRDCAGGHEDKQMLGGSCVRCGKVRCPTPKCRLCGKCSEELQECGYCRKRTAGVPPVPLK